jgi:hypothetical protein
MLMVAEGEGGQTVESKEDEGKGVGEAEEAMM